MGGVDGIVGAARYTHTIIASINPATMAAFYRDLLEPSGHYLNLITQPYL